MSSIDIIIALAIGLGLLLAIRAIVKAKKKGECIGCSKASSGCCSHGSLEDKCNH